MQERVLAEMTRRIECRHAEIEPDRVGGGELLRLSRRQADAAAHLEPRALAPVFRGKTDLRDQPAAVVLVADVPEHAVVFIFTPLFAEAPEHVALADRRTLVGNPVFTADRAGRRQAL